MGDRRFSREGAFQLRGMGLSYAEVADRLGVSAAAVWQALNEGRAKVHREARRGRVRRSPGGVQVSCYMCEGDVALLRERALLGRVSVSLLVSRILLGVEPTLGSVPAAVDET